VYHQILSDNALKVEAYDVNDERLFNTSKHLKSLEAFAATEFNKILSGRQLHQGVELQELTPSQSSGCL
jgi:hypothetical protein